jgi:predicted transport protein
MARATEGGWACPRCKRRFTRANQRHACGTAHRVDVLRDRSPELRELYAALEAFAKSLGTVEIVARERYVLFRSKRIFADVVVMKDALRLAIHLARKVDSELFIKVVADQRHVTHVAKLHEVDELEALRPLLREAYDFSKR